MRAVGAYTSTETIGLADAENCQNPQDMPIAELTAAAK